MKTMGKRHSAQAVLLTHLKHVMKEYKQLLKIHYGVISR